MKLIILFILGVSLLFGIGYKVQAAPAPTLFVYNDSTKQCGTFRDGDEYVRYDLPDAWQTYDYEKSIEKTTQQYCDELGYKNVGNVVRYLNLKQITIRERSSLGSSSTNYIYPIIIIAFTAILTITILLVVIIYLKKHKK